MAEIERGGWGLLGNGLPDSAAWPCPVCGGVVVDREVHGDWHERHGDPRPEWSADRG